MANKISQLADATTPLAGTEYVWIEQSGNNRKVAASELSSAGGLSGSANESITGNWTFYQDTIGDHVIWRNGTTGAAGLAFRNDDGVKGYIGFDDAGNFTVWDSATSAKAYVSAAGSYFADGTYYVENLHPVLYKRTADGTATNQWVRIAKRESANGRGSSRVRVHTYGGSQTPSQMEIMWSTDWTGDVQHLSIPHAGGAISGYVQQIRSTRDAGSTATYLEIYVNGTSVTLGVEVVDLSSLGGSLTSAVFETSFTAGVDRRTMTVTAGYNTDTTQPLSFGSVTRQMLNLWGTGYGIGVQASTTYFRTGSNFAWYVGGVHDDVALAPGTGGALAAYINATEMVVKRRTYVDISGTKMTFRQADGTVEGHLYGDSGSNFGILNNVGNWSFLTSPTTTSIYGYNGTASGKSMIAGYDTYVRLNDGSQFSNGVYTPGNLRVDGTLYLNSATVGLSVSSGAMHVTNASGYVTVGPQNTSYCHFITDRGTFYFNTNVEVNGALLNYNGGTAQPYLKLVSPTGVSTGGKVTVDTGTPSGGSDGDIWLEREA